MYFSGRFAASTLGLFALAVTSDASPFTINTCALVTGAVSALHKASTASSFCSSFLHLKPTTVTSTITSSATSQVVLTTTTGTRTIVTTAATDLTSITQPTISTIPTSTTTTISSTTTTIELTTSTVTATIGPDCNPTVVAGPAKVKRSTASSPNPLAAFESSVLSTACSCLSLPIPSTTSYVTATKITTVTSTHPVAVTIVNSLTVTDIVTDFSTAFTTSITTITTKIVSTVTVGPTSTVTSGAPPAQCTDTSRGYGQYVCFQRTTYCLSDNTLTDTNSFGNPAATQFDLINGEIVIVYNGQVAVVPDAINGGTLNFVDSSARGSQSILQCAWDGISHDPLNCYNALGQLYTWYQLPNSKNVGLGLVVPVGATTLIVYWKDDN